MSGDNEGRGFHTSEEFVQHIVAQLEQLNAQVHSLHIDFVGHKAETDSLHRDINELKSAFPKDADGKYNYSGHNYFHYSVDKTKKSWSEIWMDVKKKIFGGIAWAVILLVSYSIWEYMKLKIKQ